MPPTLSSTKAGISLKSVRAYEKFSIICVWRSVSQKTPKTQHRKKLLPLQLCKPWPKFRRIVRLATYGRLAHRRTKTKRRDRSFIVQRTRLFLYSSPDRAKVQQA